MDALCDHIISLILEKMPLKPLLRCKCLSKRWLSLSSAEHLSRETHMPGLIVRTIYGRPPFRTKLLPLHTGEKEEEKPRDLSLRLPGGDGGIKIVASGNGLLFCVREGAGGRIGDDCYLYNPFTRDYVVVPRPSRCPRGGGAHGLKIGLAFNLPNNVGDVVVSAFQRGTWHRDPHWCEFGFEIYSLARGEWRVSNEVSKPCNIYDPFRVLVCQTGAVFWNSLLCWSFWSSKMLEFDPVAETSRWGAVPCGRENGLDPEASYAGWLGEHHGDLVFIAVSQPLNGVQGQLFMYAEDKESPFHHWLNWPLDNPHLGSHWQLTRLQGLSDSPSLPPPPHIFHPVGLVRRSGGDVVVLSSPCGRTITFDVHTGRMEMVLDVMMHADAPLSDPANPYPLEPLYYPYFPTSKSITRKIMKKGGAVEDAAYTNMLIWGTGGGLLNNEEHGGGTSTSSKASRRSLWMV